MITTNSFEHRAFFYRGVEDFLATALPFVREGLERDELVLVAADSEKNRALASTLGEPSPVRFADMRIVGRNPGRILSIWLDFIEEARGYPARGIGEPVWPGRTPAELDECERHERLLDLAFDGVENFRLLCPYDMAELEQSGIDVARHTHAEVLTDGAPVASDAYSPPDQTATFEGELAMLANEVGRLDFDARTLAALRAMVTLRADEAGLDRRRANDLVLAVNEIASNSIRHSPGKRGELTLWVEPDAIVCEVRDDGELSDPMLGRSRPGLAQFDGRGLWVVNQVCDLVEVRRRAGGGTVVRVRMYLD